MDAVTQGLKFIHDLRYLENEIDKHLDDTTDPNGPIYQLLANLSEAIDETATLIESLMTFAAERN